MNSGHSVLCSVVKTLIVSGFRPTKGQGHLLSCSGQLKRIRILLTIHLRSCLWCRIYNFYPIFFHTPYICKLIRWLPHWPTWWRWQSPFVRQQSRQPLDKQGGAIQLLKLERKLLCIWRIGNFGGKSTFDILWSARIFMTHPDRFATLSQFLVKMKNFSS